jgi:3-methyladenine DNA glycosylase AlkD
MERRIIAKRAKRIAALLSHLINELESWDKLVDKYKDRISAFEVAWLRRISFTLLGRLKSSKDNFEQARFSIVNKDSIDLAKKEN